MAKFYKFLITDILLSIVKLIFLFILLSAQLNSCNQISFSSPINIFIRDLSISKVSLLSNCLGGRKIHRNIIEIIYAKPETFRRLTACNYKAILLSSPLFHYLYYFRLAELYNILNFFLLSVVFSKTSYYIVIGLLDNHPFPLNQEYTLHICKVSGEYKL